MSVKLSGNLPKDDDRRNGMDEIFGDLVKRPEDRHVVVLVVDCAYTKVTHSADGPYYTPTAGIIHAEPITDPGARDEVLEHLAATRAERRGESELDLDFGISDPVDRVFRDAAKTFERNNVTVSFGEKDENNDGIN